MHHFEEGENSLEDESRVSHHRSIEYADAIRALLTDYLYFSQKRMACILNIHRSTVKLVLHEGLSLRKFNFKWIPHMLDDNQELKRFRFSMEFLKFLEFLESKSKRPLANIYRGRNIDLLQQSAILNVGECRYCKANSCSTIYRSDKGNDLSLFLAFWNQKCSPIITKRNIRSWVFCWKSFVWFWQRTGAQFSKETFQGHISPSW
jgi:hypothetical protein